VYLYRGRYDSGRAFAPFLFTVAVNCCRTALSCCAGYWTVVSARGDALESAASGDRQPLASLIADEQCTALHMAIGRLPEMQRAVVLLHLLCDSDYARIAGILGRSTGTIRSQMHHALRNLRSHLEKTHTEPATPVRLEVNHD